MIMVKFKFNGTNKWWYDYATKPKSFKAEDDILTYIDKYNTNCKMIQGRGTIIDFEIL